jgi:hypothetical protein
METILKEVRGGGSLGDIINEEFRGKSLESFFGEGVHQQRLKRYCKNLQDYIEDRENGETIDNLVWWIQCNKQKAAKHAQDYVTEYIKNKKGEIAKWVQYTENHITAFKRIGVEFTSEFLVQWSMVKDSHKVLNHNTVSEYTKEITDKKEKQVDSFIKHHVDMVTMGDRFSGSQYRDEVLKPLKDSTAPWISHDAHRLVSALYRNTDDDHIFIMQLKAAAYFTVATQLGLRGNNILVAHCGDFSHEDGQEGILFNYINRKNGKKGGDRKSITRMVFHKNPTICGITRLSLYVFFLLHHGDGERYNLDMPFLYGYQESTSRDRCVTMARKQVTMLMEATALKLGIQTDGKKLHIFRGICTNIILSKGASDEERQSHLGWKRSVEAQHYASAKNIALGLRTPYMLAGRDDGDDGPHTIYHCVDKVPGELLPDELFPDKSIQRYFGKVALTAMAAGYVPQHYQQYFQWIVQHQKFVELKEMVKSWVEGQAPVLSKRTMESVQLENAELRAKVVVLNNRESLTTHTEEDLKGAVDELIKDAKSDNFMKTLENRFKVNIVPKMNQLATSSKGFYLKKATSHGSALHKIIRLVAFVKTYGWSDDLLVERGEGKSWLNFYKTNQKNSKFATLPAMDSWFQFRSHYNF